SRSPVSGRYDTRINRESAAELLAARIAPATAEGQSSKSAPESPGALSSFFFGTKSRQGLVETMAKQTVRTMGNQVGRKLLRGLLGGLLGGSRRR
ncbi:MAG: DUF853 family protein, partial [Candidatus Cloacimonetes bacterium]|nr:DUF853 family protein [Candidatus Cloacimonadota bacterium]